jgi:hypothetical protein
MRWKPALNAFDIAYPPAASRSMARDPRATARRVRYGASGEGHPWNSVVPPGGGLLDTWSEPTRLPGWLIERDLDVYAADFARTGFTGGLRR